MEIVEWVGVISGILAVYLLYSNNILTWPVGFLNIFCFLWMFWNQKLYGDFIVQIIFFIVGILGWINWNKKSTNLPEVLKWKQTLLWIFVTLASIPFTTYYFKNYTDCSYPIAEAGILSISIAGQFLTAMRKIENWYFWLVADFMMGVVYALKGLYPTAIYALIIFVIGIFGILKWQKIVRNGFSKDNEID